MKKIIALTLCLLLTAAQVFCQDKPADDIYVYESNGRGDQILRVSMLLSFPMNYNKNLNFGGGAELSYYRFLNTHLALGGELSALFNTTVGGRVLTSIPVCFGVFYQPYFDRLEFPVGISAGLTYSTCGSDSYFPGPILKANAGAFFRISESWSFGLSASYSWMPEWWINEDNELKYDYLSSVAPSIIARYHF